MDRKRVNLSILLEKWPSPYVARSEVEKFSGGILKARTVANLDSQGKGPKVRFRVGKKVVYTAISLIEFMQERSGECTDLKREDESTI
ncbi:MAG TPA: hypothetical protein PKJ72_07275 [Deltaproteobacteria bacterium]|nr:hypothetical protein [Deltaproteobacteria bacterium]HNS89833.1 hypothetical protein [Deltaproteobacteria bacterium]HOY75067.1 hypothetical protein [Deltaproteobacteria bacterium]HQM71995.1 hypothetical protein [Deltaproteobacteria bacterium]HUM18664.1 hypothetical protein [Deltaproteobacteria bacterium]